MPAEWLNNGDYVTDEGLIIDDGLDSIDQLVCGNSESVIYVEKRIFNSLNWLHSVRVRLLWLTDS